MKFISFALIVFSAILLCHCASDEKIINQADYDAYLKQDTDKALIKCNEEMAFWYKKLSAIPASETYRLKLAGLFSSRFMLNGEIEDIKTSDSLYNLVLNNTTQDYASVHRAMAANCITQHQFIGAYQQIQKSLILGEGKTSSLYMLVDVNLELGDTKGAKSALKKFANKNSFNYLIRKAKIQDHEGNLDSAILLMEKALNKVKTNPDLALWAQSNLADMYGHANRVKESYQMFLTILKQNPDYDYALKGIAWIAFSHDHNFSEAKRIVKSILPKRATPDMHLLLAQIADAENDPVEKKKQLDLFTKSATQTKYGDMYNKYVALLEAEEFSNPAKTIEIAKREISNRPTTQSYDLLAWGYLQQGNKMEALTIAQENIKAKTYEPDALYHLGMIYQANGMEKEASYYLKQAAESSFELGPAITKKIKSRLNS